MRVTETRASRERDSYRIVRVNFRRAHPAWWDDPTIVAILLTLTVLLAGLLVVLPPRLSHGG